MTNRLATRQLRRPAAEICQQRKARHKPPPEEQPGQARKQALVVDQEAKLDAPERGPEQDDDGELHPQESCHLLHECRRRQLLGVVVVEVEHGVCDDLVHGANSDKDCDSKVYEAIVEGQSAVNPKLDARPGGGEEDRNANSNPDKCLWHSH